jgi:hypothetical protein
MTRVSSYDAADIWKVQESKRRNTKIDDRQKGV